MSSKFATNFLSRPDKTSFDGKIFKTKTSVEWVIVKATLNGKCGSEEYYQKRSGEKSTVIPKTLSSVSLLQKRGGREAVANWSTVKELFIRWAPETNALREFNS